MKDRIFLDTDIIVYAYGKFEDEEKRKREKAEEILKSLYKEGDYRISTQVIQEFCSIISSKMKPVEPEKAVSKFIDTLPEDRIVTVDIGSIKKALEVKDRYNFSFRDSLIIATALDAGCTVIYTEDMCSTQIVDNLQIVNPLK